MEKSRAGIAAENHRNGYNCCQAVVCAYCQRLGVEKSVGLRISEGFGGGIAGMGETCGAVCAMILLAGLKNSDGNLERPGKKAETYQLAREMAGRFKEWNQSIVCKELKGGGGKGILRSCRGCVIDGARIIEEMLFPGEFEPYDGADE